MPRDLTKVEIAREDIRCTQGLIAGWERRSDEAAVEQQVDHLENQIIALRGQQDTLLANLAAAPEELTKLRAKLDAQRQALKLELNKGLVERMKKALETAAMLQAEINRANASL